MFPAMLFAISIVALAQFALYYWRAMLVGAAARPVSDRTLAAAHVQNGQLTGSDFATLVRLHELTPELRKNTGGLGVVRLYYWIVNAIGSLSRHTMPAVAAWTDRELAVCARFAAVQVDRRLQANLELAAAMRSC